MCIRDSVSYDGITLHDGYYNPRQRITNYLTQFSGVTAEHLQDAPFFEGSFKQDIFRLLDGSIIVGYDLQRDFESIGYECEPERRRDLKCYPCIQTADQPIGLRRLAKQHLNIDIQNGFGHDSVEDASVSMQIFRLFESEWEKQLEEMLR
eukprot:TRINITY_DN4308_c0_g2_i1.p1 TRINITY_DN4308_c0_g2~~TRINITY_DN4308_c0_g2_i1.p1  ORF type:complete len:170 (-),score=25.87 TRINITY_DN4308_c0_g2_i1:94-543(-)